MAFLSTWASDVRKAKREDQRKWDDEVRMESRKFLTSTAQVSAALEVLHNEASSDKDVTDAQALYDEHHRLMREHLDGLYIVAPHAVMQKVLRIHAKMSAIRVYRSGSSHKSKMAIRDLSTEMLTALRKEIGVRNESIKPRDGNFSRCKKRGNRTAKAPATEHSS